MARIHSLFLLIVSLSIPSNVRFRSFSSIPVSNAWVFSLSLLVRCSTHLRLVKLHSVKPMGLSVSSSASQGSRTYLVDPISCGNRRKPRFSAPGRLTSSKYSLHAHKLHTHFHSSHRYIHSPGSVDYHHSV